ncbi:MAG TPA: 4-hydroxythreonine-4-phosphate dehydrogenase PdxA [Bryobacterales bacterium]|nr:4-hydroxythreonine-4-phosphate dehydrogenase PdxA [Bryobacterales bacterium]
MISVIGITAGDPAGIGPEVAAKAAASGRFDGRADLRILGVPSHAVPMGKASPECGRMAVETVRAAVAECLAGRLDAIVTGPINKYAVEMAGIPFTGHTEFIADLCGVRDVRMLLASDRLRVIHVSTHVSLAEACRRATADRIGKTIELAALGLQLLGEPHGRIAVAGLNPHCGENGLFGSEDREQIVPAIERAAAAGLHVTGPISPDAIFHRAASGEFAMVVAMYHDQGHIPSKLIAFQETVNVTLGLPIIRTSVDHGTAFDIAGQNRADPTNMICAIEMALKLIANRRCPPPAA